VGTGEVDERRHDVHQVQGPGVDAAEEPGDLVDAAASGCGAQQLVLVDLDRARRAVLADGSPTRAD